eukprot:205193-Chlamydomonas_euryale.AAC.1
MRSTWQKASCTCISVALNSERLSHLYQPHTSSSPPSLAPHLADCLQHVHQRGLELGETHGVRATAGRRPGGRRCRQVARQVGDQLRGHHRAPVRECVGRGAGTCAAQGMRSLATPPAPHPFFPHLHISSTLVRPRSSHARACQRG